MCKVQEINERHHEHPHQIDEVPIKTKDFDIVGVVAAALITQADYEQSDYAAGHVGEMQAGNAEE